VYLQERKLLKLQPSPGTTTWTYRLTVRGIDCVTEYGGDVSRFTSRPAKGSGDTTNIYIPDNKGNMLVASSNFVQNISSGLEQLTYSSSRVRLPKFFRR
jgi:hypothetical protein